MNEPARESRPAVSVGMPVYNGAASVAAAIQSILAQTLQDFELIVADNASNDNTEEICRALAEQDVRIKYFRHNSNLGALHNFLFVLDASVGDYFVWAAVDDDRSSDFLENNARFLDNNSDYVASISPVFFEGGEADPFENGDGLLDDADVGRRVTRFLSVWHANSCFYSLFRREPLLASVRPVAWYLAFDWSIMLRLAKKGRFARVSEGWMQRGGNGLSSRMDILTSSRSKAIHWLLPLWDVSRIAFAIVANQSLSRRLSVLKSLACLNYSGARIQFGYERRKWLRKRSDRKLTTDPHSSA